MFTLELCDFQGYVDGAMGRGGQRSHKRENEKAR